MRYFALFSVLLLTFIVGTHFAGAVEGKDTRSKGASGLPLPRFVSIKASKANVRRGPGRNYPIQWQYQRRNLPVQVVAEYGQWRQIQDFEGSEGWIHAPLLSGARHVLFRETSNAIMLRARPEPQARIAALIQPGVIGALERCEGVWCKVDTHGHRGWVGYDRLWGIHQHEVSN